MFARASRFVLFVPAFAMLAAWPAALAQQSAPTAQELAPPAPEIKLTGTWQFDDDAIREDPRNWRRPVNGGRPIPSGGVATPPDRGGAIGGAGDPVGPGAAGPRMGGLTPRSAGSLGEPWDTEVRRALRDLLEVTQRYTIKVDPGQVTIQDDLDRRWVFLTDGREEKFRSGGTEFKARTQWDGSVLKQEIQANQFRMSQAFMLASDESSMFVWLNVDKPELVPPIKKLTRVYVRVK